MPFNIIDHPVVLHSPARVVEPAGWVGHIPFAFAIVSVLKPGTIVELGTHSGNSYLAFCEAVKELGLPSACVAVDTWLGDAHSQHYGPDVLEALRAFHDQRYGGFSELRQCLFDQALSGFADGSIDLLHIDGMHSYDAVAHDFHSWLPKISDQGVVLLHDTAVTDRGFGVWELFAKLRQRYPAIEFRHSYGLGVLYVGKAPMPTALADLFAAPEAELARCFERLGRLLLQRHEIEMLRRRIEGLEDSSAVRQERVVALEARNAKYAYDTNQLREEIGSREVRLNDLGAELTRLNAELAAANTRVVAAEGAAGAAQELARLRERQLDDILRSTSWRIASPLRFAKRCAQGFTRAPRAVLRLVRQVYCRLPLRFQTRVRLRTIVEGMGGGGLLNAAVQQTEMSQRGDISLVHPLASRPEWHSAGDKFASAYAVSVEQASGKRRGINLDYVPLAQDSLAGRDFGLKLIAFYLPQFHPIPENDEWWGRGFTEWTNVSKAVSQFTGHYQPRLPGELGFYDLRVPDVMRRQVELAKQYGIGGFCFHYYWFEGRRLLELPLDQYLANPEFDLPFCICWANENWTRRWDGSEADVLIGQAHTPESDEQFIRDVAPMFSDPRYIRVGDRPVLIVYRISLLPDAKATVARWREYCRMSGVGEIYVVSALTFEVRNPHHFGCDAGVEFPPHQLILDSINDQVELLNPDYQGKVYDYRDMVDLSLRRTYPDFVVHRTVVPSWDNEARKPGRGHSFHHASPQRYAEWLRKVCVQTEESIPADSRLLFVNAWNEWAEGAHLEPDRRYGYAYLHATANVMREYVRLDENVALILAESRRTFTRKHTCAVVAHLFYDDLASELAEAVQSAGIGVDVFVSVRSDIDLAALEAVRRALPSAYLLGVPNRGRDMAPFLALSVVVEEMGYEFACKLHGKKSLHRKDGDQWRRSLIGSLLGDGGGLSALSAFRANSQLSVVAPKGSLVSLAIPDCNVLNRNWLDRLLPRIGAGEQVGRYSFDFIAGSMFWYRVEALSPLKKLGISCADFEVEVGQLDGTLAHAMERLLLLCATDGDRRRFAEQRARADHD